MVENIKATNIQTHTDMLREWGGTCERALEAMIAHIWKGLLLDDTLLADDTLANDFNYLRHLMGRREVIVNEIVMRQGGHRGPGMPFYTEIGNREQGTGNRERGQG